jgi:hypothetical protein
MCMSGHRVARDDQLKKIRVEDAVGTRLAHDITEVIPGKYKGARFHKGHEVREQDICRLMRLGKRHLYVLDLENGNVHEDEAVMQMAEALAGPGVTYGAIPREGKLALSAVHAGLLKINSQALIDFNLSPDVMCAALHNNVPVNKGQSVAATRAIPLIIAQDSLQQALEVARRHYPIFAVKAFAPLKTRLIITGNEVFEGLIEDKFQAIVQAKLEAFGARLEETVILPDDQALIARQVEQYLEAGTELIVTTGGMSVDPDDVTRSGIMQAGAEEIYYGAAVLPGAMLQLAYKDEVPIVGIPACGLHHKATAFDLVLPRLLAGERLSNRDLAALAVGGMCMNCPECRYPACSFGKGV